MSKPHAFVALYSGETVGEAKLIAASADAELVNLAASKMMAVTSEIQDDPVGSELNKGRQNALRLVMGAEQ